MRQGSGNNLRHMEIAEIEKDSQRGGNGSGIDKFMQNAFRRPDAVPGMPFSA